MIRGSEREETVRTEREKLAGDANRKDTSASGGTAGIDELGEARIALVDNSRGARSGIVNQTRRNRG